MKFKLIYLLLLICIVGKGYAFVSPASNVFYEGNDFKRSHKLTELTKDQHSSASFDLFLFTDDDDEDDNKNIHSRKKTSNIHYEFLPDFWLQNADFYILNHLPALPANSVIPATNKHILFRVIRI